MAQLSSAVHNSSCCLRRAHPPQLPPSPATSNEAWQRRQFSTNRRPRNYLRYTHTQTQNQHTVRPCFMSSACKNFGGRNLCPQKIWPVGICCPKEMDLSWIESKISTDNRNNKKIKSSFFFETKACSINKSIYRSFSCQSFPTLFFPSYNICVTVHNKLFLNLVHYSDLYSEDYTGLY